MKRILLLAAAAAAFTTTSALAQVIAYEGFGGYTDGADLNGINGGTNWPSNSWTASTPDFEIDNSGGLSYLGLQTSAGAVEKLANGGGGSFRREFQSSNASGTYFFSFLYDDNGSGNDFDQVFQINETGSISRFRIYGNTASDQFELAVDLAGGDGTQVRSSLTSGLNTADPVFIVIELAITAATDDTFTAYFNPTDLADIAGTAVQTLTISETDARAANGGSGAFAAINAVGISSTNAVNVWDEIRIGQSLADVAPVPEPATYALYAGALAMGLILIRRRYR